MSQSQDPSKVNWRFNPITPEDWRANEAPLADLYQRGLISAEYVRSRLDIPESAGKGSMLTPPPVQPKLSTDIKQPEERRGKTKARPALLMRTSLP